MEALHQKNNDVAVAEAGAEADSFMAEDYDLLNFNLDDGEDNRNIVGSNNSIISKGPSIPLLSHHTDDLSRTPSFPGFVEEELEWLSNKDAFPSVETCFDLLTENPDIEVLNHQSPVSVLENSSSSSNSNGNSSGNGITIMSCSGNLNVQVFTNFPVRARSKRRMRRRTGFGEFSSQHLLWFKQVNIKGNSQGLVPMKVRSGSKIGRRCLHCQTDQTPQWRTGPMGPKTLCNACGVRYKSGRLVPEYRPASSPTFSATLHSNSHRKIIEMRRQKQLPTGGFIGNGNEPENGELGL